MVEKDCQGPLLKTAPEQIQALAPAAPCKEFRVTFDVGEEDCEEREGGTAVPTDGEPDEISSLGPAMSVMHSLHPPTVTAAALCWLVKGRLVLSGLILAAVLFMAPGTESFPVSEWKRCFSASDGT